MRHTGLQLMLTISLTKGQVITYHHIIISKQTLMKVTNSGASTKDDFNLS